MAQSLAQNAIALLIDLAERGEINPWDVQVIDVIDRFLNELNPLAKVHSDRALYETDLSQSGQAFLYASMLVLLKADNLARADNPPEEALEPIDFEEPILNGNVLPFHLERQLRRRAVARPPQQRPVTLQELIDQLQLISQSLSTPNPRKRPRRNRAPSRSQTVRAIAQLAHQENLSEIALALEEFLLHQWPHLCQDEEWLDFEQLLSLWHNQFPSHSSHPPTPNPQTPLPGVPTPPESASVGDRVGVFWALLFLSAQSKVELSQDEFYQDLKIRSYRPPVSTLPWLE